MNEQMKEFERKFREAKSVMTLQELIDLNKAIAKFKEAHDR